MGYLKNNFSRNFALCALLALIMCASLMAAARSSRSVDGAGRIISNFNPGWRFIKSDPASAQEVAFDDSAWTAVSLPHTYNDVDTFDDWSLPGHRGEQNQWSGRTWYRKTFKLPASYKGKRVFIEFQGARQVAEIYFNGVLLGTSKTGFTPFGFDLTPYLKYGSEANVLAVMCDNRFARDPLDEKTKETLRGSGMPLGPVQNTDLVHMARSQNEALPENVEDLRADQIPWNNPHWHPAHGGLYRDVKLYVTDPLHIELPLYSFLQTAGPYAYTTHLADASADISVEVPIINGRANQQDAELRVSILDATGKSAFVTFRHVSFAAGERQTVVINGAVKSPQLWSPDHPYLYRVVSTVLVKGVPVDSSEIPLGIRVARWDVQNGFVLNGQHLKLHGWGQKPTDEWPGLGAALPDWLHFYTLQLMKDAGGNFLRWGHSAAAMPQINASDKLGIIVDQPGVDGEADTARAAWTLRASAFRDVLIYFRNNPSIFIWEAGNQKVTHDHAKEMHDLFEKYDPHGGRVVAYRRADKTVAQFMDIGIGTEGGREIAGLPVVEGEYDREESPRRVWDTATPPNFGYPEAKGQTYQLTSEQFAVNEVAQYVRKLGARNHSGGANWIFSDTTSGGRVGVEVTRAGGEVDGVRLPKEAYYVCAAMFRGDPQVHIIGHWNYPAGTHKPIYVASNGDEVELFLNGAPVGRGQRSDRYLFTFLDVQWKSGDIKAVAYLHGKAIVEEVKRTTGPAAALKLTPITSPDGLRADGSDIALVDVEAVDAHGNRVPDFQQRADFALTGPAIWRGGYNSGKIKSTNNTFLDLEAGINRIALRATSTSGVITLKATSEGLRPATLTLTSKPFAAPDGIAAVQPSVPLPNIPRVVAGFEAEDVGDVPATAERYGRFTPAFSYSGPSAKLAHVERDAANGKSAYFDDKVAFTDLPQQLIGADWVQASNRESLYSAVDLMQMTVTGGATVYIAHDERLPVPAWLSRQYEATSTQIMLNGASMKLFSRKFDHDQSLTLGSNTEESGATAGNMFVVFVKAN
jgi:beta-galactosidase